MRRHGTRRRSGRRGARRQDEVVSSSGAAALLSASVLIAPELLGGVYGWGVAIVAALAALSITAAWISTRRSGVKEARSVVVVFGIVAVAWTAVQALPLPCEWTALLAPQSTEQFRAATAAMGTSGGMCSLSWDPGSTRLEVLKGASYLAFFLAAWVLTFVGKRRVVLLSVGGSVTLMAAVALGHELFGADKVFGLYAPVHANPQMLAPLLNDNHLAGFMVLGVPLLLGLAIEHKEQGLRIALGAAAVLAATVGLLSLSRGGTAGILAGVGGLIIVLGFRSRRRRRSRRGLLLLIPVTAVVLGVSLTVVGSALVEEFGNGSLRKLDLIARSADLAFAHPIAGVGRGSFSAAFAAQGTALRRFTHPENLVVQWAAEWGIPVAALLLFGIVSVIVRGLRHSRSPATLGATVGLLAMGLQNMVDFNLELAGVAAVAAVALGVVSASVAVRAPQRGGIGLRRGVPVLAGFAVLCACVLGPRAQPDSVFSLENQLRRSAGTSRFHDVLDRAVALHPAEPSIAVLAADEALRRGDPSALRWANRAMQLAPEWTTPHLQTARWLFMSGRESQAIIELREAAARDPTAVGALLCWLLQRSPDSDVIERVVPPGDAAVTVLDTAARCLPFYDPLAEHIDEQLLDLQPDLLPARVRRARRLVRAGQAAEAFESLESLDAGASVDVYLVRSQAKLALGDAEGALAALQGAEDRVSDPRPILFARARALAAASQDEAMRETIEQARGLSLSSAANLSESYHVLGQIELSRGHDGRALRAFEEAYRLDPSAADLAKIGTIARAFGDNRRAFTAFRELVRMEPHNEAYRQALNEIEQGMNPPGRPNNPQPAPLDPPAEGH